MIYRGLVQWVFMVFLGIGLLGACSDKEILIPDEDPNPDPPLGVVQYEGDWYQAGDTIYGFKEYIKLVVGHAEVPLLLGIPHDGRAVGNPEIPETGDTGGDLNTRPHTLDFAELFKEDTELQPWIIINEIGRRRVDPNTYPDDVEGRYGTGTDARKTYDSYHELLLLAYETMTENLANTVGGLFLDMHGHAHRYANGHEEPYIVPHSGNIVNSNFIDQSELGYGLASAMLEEPSNSGLIWIPRIEQSSIAGLFRRTNRSESFAELLRGSKSYGGMLQAEGVNAVPSPNIPILERDAELFGGSGGQANRRPYFNGGYVSRIYGSATVGNHVGIDPSGVVSSIQIESPGITVRNNANVRSRSTHQFKRATIEYLNYWYGYNFPNSAYPYEFYWD